MNVRRAAVLAALRDCGAPLGVADIAGLLGVHANTARFHLDALVAEGAVIAALEPASGPGRPRTVYRPSPGMDRGGARGYLLLARILLSNLASAGAQAPDIAARAGRAWGSFLAERPLPFQHLTTEKAAGRLTRLLDDLGFAPEQDGEELIRLRHCPFLELAEEYGDLVCRVHLGLMQGALAESGAPLAAARLEPFAEPGACLAHLEHVTGQQVTGPQVTRSGEGR